MPAPRRLAVGVLAATALAASCLGSCAAATSGVPTPAPTVETAATGPAPAAPTSAEPGSIRPAAPAPAAGKIVVLDPGHNGGNAGSPNTINRQVPDGRGGTKPCNTTGTSTDAGYAEHAFTWDVAQRVKASLEQQSIRVVMTRSSDVGVGPCVDERGAAGARAGAAAVVSIHADGSAAGNRGFHVAYSSPPLNDAQRGPALDLSRDLRDALRDGNFAISDYIGKDGLSPRPDLAGLSLSTVPTALVECANMRNAQEAALVSSPAGRARYAAAITEGITRFLTR
ncbi:MAG: N-acetylmuramoyl-L-alanine amidase [Pseudonocardia sp.]|nr:N-acetylmuramoyl-L-alanine amidase [Pseudonocardia sp.]